MGFWSRLERCFSEAAEGAVAPSAGALDSCLVPARSLNDYRKHRRCEDHLEIVSPELLPNRYRRSNVLSPCLTRAGLIAVILLSFNDFIPSVKHDFVLIMLPPKFPRGYRLSKFLRLGLCTLVIAREYDSSLRRLRN